MTNYTFCKKERRQKKTQIVSDLWDNIEQSNVCVIGVQVEEAKENGTENILKETITIFSDLLISIDLQIQNAQQLRSRNDKKKNTPKYVIIKLIKSKY